MNHRGSNSIRLVSPQRGDLRAVSSQGVHLGAGVTATCLSKELLGVAEEQANKQHQALGNAG